MTHTVPEVGLEVKVARSLLGVDPLRHTHTHHTVPEVRLEGGLDRGLPCVPLLRETDTVYTVPEVSPWFGSARVSHLRCVHGYPTVLEVDVEHEGPSDHLVVPPLRDNDVGHTFPEAGPEGGKVPLL